MPGAPSREGPLPPACERGGVDLEGDAPDEAGGARGEALAEAGDDGAAGAEGGEERPDPLGEGLGTVPAVEERPEAARECAGEHPLREAPLDECACLSVESEGRGAFVVGGESV